MSDIWLVFFLKLPHCFQSGYTIAFPPAVCEWSSISASSPAFGLGYFSQPLHIRFVIMPTVVLLCISVMTNGIQASLIVLYLPFIYLILMICLHVFCSCPTGLYASYCWILCTFFIYFCLNNSQIFCEMWFANIFSLELVFSSS